VLVKKRRFARSVAVSVRLTFSTSCTSIWAGTLALPSAPTARALMEGRADVSHRIRKAAPAPGDVRHRLVLGFPGPDRRDHADEERSAPCSLASARMTSRCSPPQPGRGTVRPICAPAVELANQRLQHQGEVPLPEHLTPHKLRRTFASLLVALGVDPGSVLDQIGQRRRGVHAAGLPARHAPRRGLPRRTARARRLL